MSGVRGSPENGSDAAESSRTGSALSPTSPPSPGHRHRLHWVLTVGGTMVLVVAIAVATLGIVNAVQSAELPLGPGTATISWPNTGDGQSGSSQPFQGTAGGLDVSGQAKQPKSEIANLTPAEIANGTVKFPTTVVVASIHGTIDNRRFTLEPTLTFSMPKSHTPTVVPAQECTSTSTPTGVSIACPVTTTHYSHKRIHVNPRAFPVGRAMGTYGSMRVTATITLDAFTRSFGFAGTIGTLHITGELKVVDHDGRTETAHATFDVTR